MSTQTSDKNMRRPSLLLGRLFCCHSTDGDRDKMKREPIIFVSREGALRAAISDCMKRGISLDMIRRLAHAKHVTTKHTFNTGFLAMVPTDDCDDIRPLIETI
jgi:hypothetical protein